VAMTNAPMKRAVRTAAAVAMSLDDPIDRLTGIRSISADLDELRMEVADLYALAAFQAQRAGYSYTTLAGMLGVHDSRVGQLMKRGREVYATMIGDAAPEPAA